MSEAASFFLLLSWQGTVRYYAALRSACLQESRCFAILAKEVAGPLLDSFSLGETPPGGIIVPRIKVNVPNLAEADPGLWSNGIRAGDLLFISGQVARPFEGGKALVGNNEYEQARQIFSRIKRICEAAGGSLDDLVKMTIFMVDIKKNTEVWRARREFFSGDFPASTLVEVRSLAGPETLVEIETVAYLGRT